MIRETLTSDRASQNAMDSVTEGLLSRIELNEEMRDTLKHIEYLNQKVYDITLCPESLMDHAVSIIQSDMESVGASVSEIDVRAMLQGSSEYHSVCSKYVGFRFSGRNGFPWSPNTVSSIQYMLTSGLPGYESGCIRNRPYVKTGDTQVEESFQQYAESDLIGILKILNLSPYHSLITASLFWNCLEMLQPFQGDNRLVYRALLIAALNSRNYRGVMRIPLMKYLFESKKEIELARSKFIDSGDPNPMISETIRCISSAFDEAYSAIGPLDVKRTVDGLSRSIIRNSRRREYFILSDTHSWLGDISDQTFRARISHLIDLGILRKVGNTKGTRYQYVDAFEEVRRINGGSFPHLDEDQLQLLYMGIGAIARPR